MKKILTLGETDLTLSLSQIEYKTQVKDLQEKVRVLSHLANKKNRGTIAVFEGWDAAGKGGSIRRLTSTLDPRLYKVKSIAAPNDTEKKRHYLWRFWTIIPPAGQIGIFDRSWYGRVLVERVEGFAKPEEWQRAFSEINQFEEDLTLSGYMLMKFWLHISPEEQLNRFNGRKSDPLKRWKLTDEDWRNRDKWGLYEEAADEMFDKTSSPNAPWFIVPAIDKYYARVFILRKFCERLEKNLS
ncbi:MAG: UDP-galactose-lipid carrier transferase [Leptospira sp.]|nr:UDP-galactose-lipid carrier transferase [Leptospira sp.]